MAIVFQSLASQLSTITGGEDALTFRLPARHLGALRRPDTSLSFEIMIAALLIVVIGGMGTIYGALIGSVLLLVAQSCLQDLLRLAGDATSALLLLPGLLSPGRWLLWLGLLSMLSVTTSRMRPWSGCGRVVEQAVRKQTAKLDLKTY